MPSKCQPFLALVLAGGLLCSGPGAQVAGATSPKVVQPILDSTLKIHPLLQYGAQADPTQSVRVIVQMGTPKAKSEDIMKGSPGQVVEQFSVIPAFTVDLPQSAIANLAQNPDVRYVSPDGAVQIIPGLSDKGKKADKAKSLAKPPKGELENTLRSLSWTHMSTTYPLDTGAESTWASPHGATGAGVTVALIDSGVDATNPDLAGQVLAVDVNPLAQTAGDGYGHGTHVAGIIAGNDPAGHYIGVAPNATVISVKVADDTGAAFESDLLRGLDWVEKYHGDYHILALNLSVSTNVPASYATSPIDAAVERLWNDGVTVVTAAGNLGSAKDAVWYAPGNDPRVITVGCLDENLTATPTDDSLCSISSHGMTEDGFAKPDLIAPGRKIYSSLATGPNGQAVTLQGLFPDRVAADGRHIRLSGTSMAAPMVTGAIALLLEQHPDLTPDQLKQIVVGTAHAYPGQTDHAGVVDIVAALAASAHPAAHSTDGARSAGASAPPKGAITLVWDGKRWGNAYWVSAHWDGANWVSAHWDSAHWDSAHWDSAYWDSAHWDSAHWDSAHWDSGHWDSAHWDISANLD